MRQIATERHLQDQPAVVLLCGVSPGQAAAEAAARSAALAAEGLWVDTDARHPRAVLLCLPGALGPALPRLRQLREAWPRLPLFVLAPQARDVDQVLALEMGADAVLPEDTAPMLLAARLRALWRWQPPAAGAGLPGPEQVLRFGELCIDREQRQVTLAQRAVPLTEGEFEVLWLLASRSGEPMSRRELQRRLRGDGAEAADGRGIDSRIYRLRGKLGDRSRSSPGIRTVRHHGYLFSPAAWA